MFAQEAAKFYQQTYPQLACEHSSLFYLQSGNEPPRLFCGLCWLQVAWESEVPHKIHEYKLLAENGNPETWTVFWAHLKSNLGLIRPKPDENLYSFRLARERLYGKPSKNRYPITAALFDIMGVQPKLAHPLILTLCGSTMDRVRIETGMTTYGANQSISKGIRMVVRKIIK